MRLHHTLYISLTVLMLGIGQVANASIPPINNSPTLDIPKLLNWPRDIEPAVPDLSEPTSNRINDFHSDIKEDACDHIDIVFSTAGNYYMVLQEFWQDRFLVDNADVVRSWYYTTSPPISLEQIPNADLTIGNLRIRCIPTVVAGPRRLMDQLREQGLIEGEPEPILRNRGNVILVKKGNPKLIRTIWDLGRLGVRVVTSNPDTEAGSFGNYSSSVYQIAANNPIYGGWYSRYFTAEVLFNRVFNSRIEKKWLAGARIHHREVPFSVALGKADAGLFFYHLARYTRDTFPEKFDIVALGGTPDDPQPLPGNNIATLFVAKVMKPNGGEFTERQKLARDRFVADILSEKFTDLLDDYFLDKP